jgi:mitochondrial ATPase complex subunit ATP10
VREKMGMNSTRIGYVYLVDEKCRIRWAGCADAMKEEAHALETCTGLLLERLDKMQGQEKWSGPSPAL